ncbi:uncharacterized protein LOC141852603 [Brevipalpus obovatus]|uniref:uncharacterized protein LOC141852603 n=1 Tax=Brevipalpus obovatus TaxID=246614 RepID=UPI003D9F1FA9
MDFGKIHLILPCFIILNLKEDVTGTQLDRKQKYEKICSEYDQMVKSGVPEEQLEKLFKDEIRSEIDDDLKERNLKRRGNPWYFNSADSDVIMLSKDEIGEYGQLVRGIL